RRAEEERAAVRHEIAAAPRQRLPVGQPHAQVAALRGETAAAGPFQRGARGAQKAVDAAVRLEHAAGEVYVAVIIDARRVDGLQHTTGDLRLAGVEVGPVEDDQPAGDHDARALAGLDVRGAAPRR